MRFDLLASGLLLASFLFIAPLRYDGDQIFSLVACMFLVAFSAFCPQKRTVDAKLPAALFLFACATALWQFTWFKVYALVILFIGLLALKTIAERISLGLRIPAWILCTATVLTLGHLALQVNGLDPLWAVTYRDTGGVFGKPWALGCFAAIAVPFLFSLHPAAPILAAPLLYYSRSTLCVAAAFFGWAYLVRPGLRKWLSLAGVLCVAGFIGLEGGVENHRISVWKNTWRFIVQDLWVGKGLGTWAHSAFVRIINGEAVVQLWAHNEFWQLWYELGLVGLFLVLLWLFQLYRNISPVLRSALLVICLCAFFHPIFHWGRLVLLPVYVLGLCWAEATKTAPPLGAPKSQAPTPL